VITAAVQRWNSGRDSYRPAGEPIATRDYEVVELKDDATPRAFVERHHYSRSYPAAIYRYGLYRRAALVGTAVYSWPVNEKALAPLPGARDERLELGRFVLTDDVPANGESWFLARTFEQLRVEGLAGVLSMSDPEPRRDAAGVTVFPGHVGTIYQATNATYLGRATARTLRILPDGTVLNARAMQKVRAREQGWRYAAQLLERHGAAPLAENEDATAWLRHWLPRITRTQRHSGNHRYAWALRRRDRRHLPASMPYPKFSFSTAARAA
jgi:hypothetical protein